jgi:phosphoglycolate phosphatase-like HAD superfamily hydrolase
MDGLLAKAQALKNRLRPLTNNSTKTDFLADKEAEIMAEMNSLLERNRSKITETALTFTARSSGVMFPLFINLGAVLLLLILGFFFFLRLNQVEVSLVSREAQQGSTESLIIAALREASEEDLVQKESQIASIQGLLYETEQSKASLIQDFDRERSQLQDELRNELNMELEAERQRLVSEGLNEETLASRLASFQKQKQSEYDARIAAINADFDRQLEDRSALFNNQMADYRTALSQAQKEQESIKNSLEQQLIRSRQESEIALQVMSADRASAMEKLESLRQEQQNGSLYERRILSMYDMINASLKLQDYTAALNGLDELQEFLGSPEVMSIASMAERRNTEQFLIDSLRRLVKADLILENEAPSTNDPAVIALAILESITERVEEGNRLYAQGKVEDARMVYTTAIALIPELDEGYSRLQEIAGSQVARERSLLEQQLAESAALYRENQYQASVDKYRQALGLIEKANPLIPGMLDSVLDAGYRIRKADEPPPVPIVIREELSEDEKSLLQRAQTAENQNRVLMESLNRLKAQYAITDGETTVPTSKETLVMLLNAKMLIRRALSDEEIRKAYPELQNTLDAVFESYGEEQRNAGHSQALRDVVSLTDYLGSSSDENRQPPFKATDEASQRKLLLEFLDNLQSLLDPLDQS